MQRPPLEYERDVRPAQYLEPYQLAGTQGTNYQFQLPPGSEPTPEPSAQLTPIPIPAIENQRERLRQSLPDILAGHVTPQQRQLIDAYMEEFSSTPMRPVAGKSGTADEGLQWYSKVPGELRQTEQGLMIHDPTGQQPDRPFTYNHGYNFKTGQVYEAVPLSTDRMTFLPVGQDIADPSNIHPDWPGIIAGPAGTIARAYERAQNGIAVPDSVIAREAMEVAGAVTSGTAIPRITREALGGRAAETALGAGGGTAPARAAATRVLDPAGYYSPLREAVQALPQQGQPRQMFNQIINRGGVSEAEIRHSGIDELMLTPRVARARRTLMDMEANLSSMKGELADLQTENGMNRFVKKGTEQFGLSEEQAARNGQARIKQLQALMPDAERRVASFKDTVNGITEVRDRGGAVVREPVAGILDTAPTNPISRQEIMQALQQSRINTRETIYTPRQGVSENTQPLTPLLDEGIQGATVDPNNPTLRWHVLQVDTPASFQLQRLWATIPERYRSAVQAFRAAGYDYDQLHGLSPELKDALKATVKQHSSVLDAIDKLEAQSGFLDPHFHRFNVFGHYASSMQQAEGRPTLTVSQFQSNWSNRQQAGTLKHLKEHPVAASVESWLDPTLRRIIKDAVDQGADSITLPSAETVFGYNPPGRSDAGLRELYNKIAPKRMAAMLRELDRDAPKPERISQLDPSTSSYPAQSLGGGASPSVHVPEGHMFRGWTESGEDQFQNMREPIQGSWLRFPLTDRIREHHQQGRGMRLLSAGVPMPEDSNGN